MLLKNFFTRLRKCFWVKVIGNGYIDSNFLLKSTFVVHLLDHGEGKRKQMSLPPEWKTLCLRMAFRVVTCLNVGLSDTGPAFFPYFSTSIFILILTGINYSVFMYSYLVPLIGFALSEYSKWCLKIGATSPKNSFEITVKLFCHFNYHEVAQRYGIWQQSLI